MTAPGHTAAPGAGTRKKLDRPRHMPRVDVGPLVRFGVVTQGGSRMRNTARPDLCFVSTSPNGMPRSSLSLAAVAIRGGPLLPSTEGAQRGRKMLSAYSGDWMSGDTVRQGSGHECLVTASSRGVQCPPNKTAYKQFDPGEWICCNSDSETEARGSFMRRAGWRFEQLSVGCWSR